MKTYQFIQYLNQLFLSIAYCGFKLSRINKKDGSIKRQRNENYKHHRHVGFSLLFILSLDKWTLFYVIKLYIRSVLKTQTSY